MADIPPVTYRDLYLEPAISVHYFHVCYFILNRLADAVDNSLVVEDLVGLLMTTYTLDSDQANRVVNGLVQSGILQSTPDATSVTYISERAVVMSARDRIYFVDELVAYLTAIGLSDPIGIQTYLATVFLLYPDQIERVLNTMQLELEN